MSETQKTDRSEATQIKGIKNILFPCPVCGNRNVLVDIHYPYYYVACKLCNNNTLKHVKDNDINITMGGN